MPADNILFLTRFTSISLAFVGAWLMGILLFPGYISFLRRKQLEQFLRDEGPAGHLSKAKTPTMGGVVIALAVCYGFALCNAGIDNRLPMSVLILALCTGLIGFFDDLCKIRQKSNKGLSAKLRLLLETLAGFLFGIAIMIQSSGNVSYIIGGQGLTHASPWILYLPQPAFLCFCAFVVAATTNAVNLHDGLDGLAGGTSVLILVVMAIMFAFLKETSLMLLAISAVGSLLAFLNFNKHPAKIFMGDTGSLFLGGLIAGLVLASGLGFWFILLAGVLIAEVISVMCQVTYFKLTKPYVADASINQLKIIWIKLTKKLPGEGKRLLRMAPLHHHIESLLIEKGANEKQVVFLFWSAQLIICVLSLSAFFLF